jgi:Phosphotransferase enzyme family
VSRRVRLIVCSSSGELLGDLPEFIVESSWWSDAGPIVEGARAAFGIETVILRLLSADSPTPMMGGTVSYLAELVGDPPPASAFGPVDPGILGGDQPLRAAWARPGGVAATLSWADTVLAAAGRPRTGPAAQVKSWNLSSVLRLPTASGDIWCKSVPPFMIHEGTIIAMVAAEAPTLVPPLLGSNPATRTVLLGDVPGEDQYDAPEQRLIEMVRQLVALQVSWAGRVDELLLARLADYRAVSLPARLGALIDRLEIRGGLSGIELATLDALLVDLPSRLEALAACGLPETLVRGDFHPGNWRYGADGLKLLDWGDAGVGHPLFDLVGTFLEQVPEAMCGRVREACLNAWQAACPGADTARALELIEPIAALRAALVYQGFLDGIEPSERPYHEADVPACLRQAVRSASVARA